MNRLYYVTGPVLSGYIAMTAGGAFLPQLSKFHSRYKLPGEGRVWATHALDQLIYWKMKGYVDEILEVCWFDFDSFRRV